MIRFFLPTIFPWVKNGPARSRIGEAGSIRYDLLPDAGSRKPAVAARVEPAATVTAISDKAE